MWTLHTSLHKVAGKQFIGCRNGVLVQFDLANDKFAAFDKSDGLISNEFNEGTVFFQPKVGFFIGTPEGIMLLDTNKLSKRVSNDGIFRFRSYSVLLRLIQI